MKHIRESFKGLGNALWLGPLFKLLEAIMEVFVPLITASIIDVGVANHNSAYILSRGALMVLIAILSVGAALICQYYAATASAKLSKQLRSRVFAHAMTLSPMQVEEIGRGGLSARITNDVNQIVAALNMFIRIGTRAPFLTIGAILMAMLIDFYTGLVYLVATILIGVILTLVIKKTLGKYGQIQKGQDELFRLAQDNLEGVRVIRAFSRQDQENEEFQGSASALCRLLVHTGRISALMTPAASVVANLAVVMVVWLGAGAVNTGTMMTGDIIALVNYMVQILVALLMATNLLVLFTRALASSMRVEALLEEKPSITDGPGAKEDKSAPAFAFQNVEYHYYEKASPALQRLNFEVQCGQAVGFIGGTGSGKSTVAHLLLRHYDVCEGKVFVFGNDVRHYELQELRRHFGVVMQNARLLSGSIRSNLLFSKSNAEDDELWDALEAAQAASFVRERPDGLDSVLTEGGGGLSGGQRQRLVIARALVRRPHILVLDDAASALDYATEAALRKELKAWKTADGMPLTTLNISQRVAAIRNCDVIFVLEEGCIEACGNHQELLKTSSLYREICESQGVQY